MKLQTKIPLKAQPTNQLDYNSKIVLLGSCFSENIGAKFKYFKFRTAINPFGILFHPLGIENLVSRSVNKTYYSESDLHYYNEQWFCLDAHSKLNQTSKDSLLEVLNSQLDQTYNFLVDASHIVITLGTSWVYTHIESDTIVSNCHKIPQKQFKKTILSVDEILTSLHSTVSLVRKINPKVTFLFTVSPVRHIKDGFVENTQSKAHLITAIHKFIKGNRSLKEVEVYFPSYEIVMDELRDYRFYNADMLHPNTLAIDYIWEKFKSVWLTEEALKTSKVVAAIQSKKAHRPLNPNSSSHQEFLTILQSEIDELTMKLPHISF